MTHALLEVNQATFDDIRARLSEVGYGHLIRDDRIVMHEIAVTPQKMIAPRDCKHATGCNQSHSPVWLCECPRTPKEPEA